MRIKTWWRVSGGGAAAAALTVAGKAHRDDLDDHLDGERDCERDLERRRDVRRYRRVRVVGWALHRQHDAVRYNHDEADVVEPLLLDDPDEEEAEAIRGRQAAQRVARVRPARWTHYARDRPSSAVNHRLVPHEVHPIGHGLHLGYWPRRIRAIARRLARRGGRLPHRDGRSDSSRSEMTFNPLFAHRPLRSCRKLTTTRAQESCTSSVRITGIRY